MDERAAIAVTVLVYLFGMVAIGVACRGRTRDGTDFYLGGRRLGPLVSSLSASASSSSAWTLLGVSGYAYASGLSAAWLLPGCIGGFVLNWFLLAPALRRISHESGALTSTEVLARCGTASPRAALSAIASLIILVSLATYVASQFQGAGKMFAETFGYSRDASILIGAFIVLLYTLLGGFWAVSVTDSVQGLLMVGVAVALPAAALAAVGPGALPASLREVDVAGYASIWGDAAPAAGIGLAAGLLGIGLGYPGQPHVVNRFMALREGRRELARARAVAVSWAVVVYTGMVVLGWCARIMLGGMEDGERAFMRAANELFPPAVAGVILAAVLSAVMSTADSQLLVAASSVTHDLGLGGRDRDGMLRRSRLVVLALSAVAVVAALAVEEQIFSRVLFAWSSMGCAFGPLLLVTALRGPVGPRATMASMLAGFALSVAGYAGGKLGLLGPWAGACERVLPFVVALVIALAGSAARLRAADASAAGRGADA